MPELSRRSKIYYGVRSEDGCKILVFTEGMDDYLLPLHLDHVQHSPTGFEWGYGGSGPSQLAFSILADFGLAIDEVHALYQKFKADIVTHLDYLYFRLTSEQILNWLAASGCSVAA